MDTLDETLIMQGIEKIIADLTVGMIEGAANKTTDLLDYALDYATQRKNGISLSEYRRMHHPIHWYLMENGIIDLKQSLPRDVPAYWYLPSGNHQDVGRIVSEIIRKNESLLKCRYTKAKTIDEYNQRIKIKGV